MAAKAFIEQYLECKELTYWNVSQFYLLLGTDSLPLDIQRVISQYWELDNKTKGTTYPASCK